jgi:hypothetical protein
MGDDAAHGSEMQMFESGEQQKSDDLLDAVTRGEVETAARLRIMPMHGTS